MFSNSNYTTATLTVPSGTKSAYQSTAGWNKFTNIVEAEADNAFGKVADVVDLGLSVKWASWNVGASIIADYGGLYGAGDPTGLKTSTNYNDYYFKNGESICGTEYDLAKAKWGEEWRLPTYDELKELRDKCTWKKGEENGVKGSWVTGPNGNSIFLPCAGYREGNMVKDKDDKVYGFYWSGDMEATSSYSHNYKDLDIYQGGVLKMDGGENYMGQSIRPVYVEEGENPQQKYTITITAIGNGYVAYDGNIVRGKTSSFTVNEGTNATIKFSADEGNRLKSVKLNGTDITYDITGNQYMVSNISANTSIEVVFEAIPTYSLNITATGDGSVTYNGTSIRNQSQGFALQEGSSAVISITPDNGYRIADVKVNSKDATSQVANGKLTITYIQQDTNVEVTFEAIPATTCTLSITTTGNGIVTYDGKNVRNQTSSFTVAIGTYATILFAADEGYRLKRVTLDGKDVIADVANDQYTTSKLMTDAVLLVEFEAVPTYSMTVKSSKYGSVRFGDEVVKNETKTFSITEGASAVLTFTPDNNGHLQSVTLNGTDITQQLSNGQYTISDIRANQDVEAVFTEDVTKVTYEGVAYTVTSYSNQTVVVAAGNYGNVLVVPASFTVGGITWKVEGVAEGALMDNKGLAAVVWKPALKFTEKVSNPNLLLYVKQAQFASPDIQNVILGDMDNGETLLADNITLVETDNDNDFYCPLTFIAKHISYEHNYSMISGHKSCQGWETLVLPFDVSMMISPKGRELVPYTSWEHGSNLRPYWLYELTAEGWKAANGIKANTPYIISMPNNEAYESSYNITGDIQFVGYNVQVVASDKITNGQYGNKRLVANYRNQKANNGIYALNVNNRWNNNTDTSVEGSAFIRGLRQVRPFEAYMALEGGNAGIRAIPVFGNETTGIMTLPTTGLEDADAIYNLNGQRVNSMSRGIYIQNGRKVVKKK